MEFPELSTILPEGRVGTAEIRHFRPTRDDIERSRREPGEQFEDRVYAELRINRQLVMSDSDMEHRTNRAVVRHAHGHVFVGGLGIGMILTPILAKPEVLSLTVLERNADVIDLVAPYFQHPKLMVVHGDVHTWQPPANLQFNTIYFDIWPTRGESMLSGFNTLKRKYRAHIDKADPARWIGCWYEVELKAERRREARQAAEQRRIAALPEAERIETLRRRGTRELRKELAKRGFSPARIGEYMKKFGNDKVLKEAVERSKTLRLPDRTP